MDDFCGSQFWDWNTTWNTADPDFTYCFENTALLAVPCLFLWLSSIYEIYRFSVSPSMQIPWSVLNISKISVVSVLIILEISYSSLEITTYINDSSLQKVHYISPIVKISSLMLSLGLYIAQLRNGFYSSACQFMFWLMLSVYEAVVLRSTVKSKQDPALLALAATCSSLVFLQFIFNFFSDSSWQIHYGQHLPIDDDSKVFPDGKASFPSQLTYQWVGNLLWRGFKSPLLMSNLWELNRCDKSEFLALEFEKYSRKDCRNPSKTSSFKNMIKPIFILFGGTYFTSTVLCTTATLLSFAMPQILSLLIDFIQNSESHFVWRGYFYAGLLAVTSVVKASIYHRHFYLKVRILAFIKSVLSSVVYRKALIISNSARKEKTVGEMVNLMSVDVMKVSSFVVWLNEYWDSSAQIILATYFLHQQLGLAIFAGVAVLVVLIPLNLIVTKKMESYQTAQMAQKDERVKLMNEILSGMKILKLYAWEPSFEKKVKGVRATEISILKKSAILWSIVQFIWTCTPVLVAVSSFGTYVLMGNTLDAKKAFVSLSLFNLLNEPATFFPMVLAKTVELFVSVRRLNSFINAEEIDTNDIEHIPEEEEAVLIENADFTWESENVTLKDLNLRVAPGSLVAVVGLVGCGKSSLLSALLGEMKKLRGRVNVNGKVAYVSQQPWIQNNTLQNNIYFGNHPDPQRYNKVLENCALLPDLEVLPGGDQTEIGEKGINLSGGQKQRVALARAAYNNADIYLFDDPLSAVDAHVGKHIFDQLIGQSGLLKTKTRILVTHALTYLPQMDQIIVLVDGRISECGSYNELLNKQGAFSDFLINYVSENNAENIDSKTVLGSIEKIQGSELKVKHRHSSVGSEEIEEVSAMAAIKSENDKLIEEEKAEIGTIKLSVVLAYVKTVNWFVSVGLLLMFTMFQVLAVGSNVWLSHWASATNDTTDSARDRNLSVYAAIGFSQCIVCFIIAIVLSLSTLIASKKLHDGMLSRILRAPMSFFETTPLGRIVNRFSADIESIDKDLPANLSETLDCLFKVLAILVVISWSTPLFLILVAFVAVIFVFIQRYYIATARQLFRLDSIYKSPVFSHFTETLNGVSTIRAFGVQERFIEESCFKIDDSVNTTLHMLICRRWLGLRLEMLGCCVIFFAALFSVMGRGSISASVVGLSVSYALQISQVLSWFTILSAYLETNLVSVERICEYTKTVQEAEWTSTSNSPPETWPDQGVVQFNGYETRYRENLDPVLKNITCTIEAGEKVGIVGRTGAGKSSMTLALFRIIEASNGSINIDGENLSHLGLHDIRGRLTIIPQDPVLFSGTLRFNLDPFSNYSDGNLWTALEIAHLKTFVQGLAEGLEHEIIEGGDNLSVGQRQLLCLARAILRKSKILILDEATASIDLETDDLLQKTIRKEFRECTVLTIAHRINTIMDSNRVMVLDNGEIMEFDTPEKLLENKSSLFYKFAKDAGLVNG